MFALDIIFLILTKNEESSIVCLINDLCLEVSKLPYKKYDILVLDDSTDATAEQVKILGFGVVAGENKGLGAAYRLGLKKCLERKPKYIVSLDGDGQVDVSELSKFILPLEQEVDLVIGSRFKERPNIKYEYPKINYIGSRLLAKYLSVMSGQKITDSHGGFRAMKSQVAATTLILGNHTYVQETIIEAAESHYKILEIPSAWKIRKHGSSRVVSSIPKYIKKVGPILAKRFIKKLLFGRSR